MIERNRGFDRQHLSSLEDKIKELESQITKVKRVGEDRKLDKLEQSLRQDDELDEPSLLVDDEVEMDVQDPVPSAKLPLCLTKQTARLPETLSEAV